MTSSSLISHERIPTSLNGAVAVRVRHRSTDLRGRPTESTGLVVAPAAPGAGRRVLTWCHGTTGLGDAACPSAQDDPAGELRTYFSPGSTAQIDYGVPGLQRFVDDGWVVCATDYQGLGTDGMHHYSVNRTNALDAVHVVRAAQELDLGAGTRFGVAGWSQGGAAAAALAELSDMELAGLELVGSVAMSPAVPTMGLKNPTGMGAALAGGDVAPDGHLVMTFAAFADAFSDELRLEDVFTPLGVEIVEAAWNTQPVHHFSDTVARMYRLRGPVLQVDHDRLPAWVAAMTEASAGRVRPRCPVLMAVDSFDGGTVVPVAWQTAYADAVTALGGDITTVDYPDDDHFSLPQSCVDDAREWLGDRF